MWSSPTGLMIRVPPWRPPTGQTGGAERSTDPLHDRCQLLQILISCFGVVVWPQARCDGPPKYPTSGSQWATQGVAIRPTRSGLPSIHGWFRWIRRELSVRLAATRPRRRRPWSRWRIRAGLSRSFGPPRVIVPRERGRMNRKDARGARSSQHRATATTKARRHEGIAHEDIAPSQLKRKDRKVRKEHRNGHRMIDPSQHRRIEPQGRKGRKASQRRILPADHAD